MRAAPRAARAQSKEASVRNRLLAALAPRRTVHAHCDLPCGVYDPEQARIEAESCYQIIKKADASDDPLFKARAVGINEERAELAKKHQIGRASCRERV